MSLINAYFYDIIMRLIVSLPIIILVVLGVAVPKKKDYEYTKLDKKGYVTNIILSAIYVPLSIIGVFTIFFADAPTTDYSALKEMLLNIVVYIGLSIPLLSIASIFTSVIARKRGKSRFSFIIQFLPIPIFIIMMILVFFMLNA